MRQIERRRRLTRLAGYLLIPHELLHLVGFRLVGQRCEYQWGQPYVTPIGSMKRQQDLVGMLFPFLIFFILVTIFAILAGLASNQVVREGRFFWFAFWLTLTHVAGIYAGTTIGDLRRAYLLLFNKPWYSWTPFDFCYWPIVDWDEIRTKVRTGEIDAKQD